MKRGPDRRKIERRVVKRGVTARIEDQHPEHVKRIKSGQFVKRWLDKTGIK